MPVPERKEGQVLIRMAAGGLNRVDLYMRNSGAGITHRLPIILGLDGAGVVVEADRNSAFRADDPVVIYPGQPCETCEFCRKGEEVLCTGGKIFGEQVDGTFAEYVAAPEGGVMRKPESLDFVQGASLSVAWLTAWRMVVTKARVQPGDTALIFGIGGSVSLAATQIAGAIGARAIVTSRDAGKLARMAAFGAAETALDEGGSSILDRVMALTSKRGVDVVIENVGKAVWPTAMKALVRGGRTRHLRRDHGRRPLRRFAPPVHSPTHRVRLDARQPLGIARSDRLHRREEADAAHRPDFCACRHRIRARPARIRAAVRQDRVEDRGVSDTLAVIAREANRRAPCGSSIASPLRSSQ